MTKSNKLAAYKKLKSISYYDSITGKLFWTQTGSGRIEGNEVGSIDYSARCGYRRTEIHINKSHVRIQLHRYIWWLYYGEIPDGLTIDHRDRHRFNNRIDNLRLATPTLQMLNSAKSKGIWTSQFIGVCQRRKLWGAKFLNIDLGRHQTETFAAKVRDFAVIECELTDWTPLNFTESEIGEIIIDLSTFDLILKAKFKSITTLSDLRARAANKMREVQPC